MTHDVQKQLAVLHAVMRVVAEARAIASGLDELLPAICNGMAWDVGAAWLVDEEANVLRCVAFSKSPAVHVPGFEAATRAAVFVSGIGLPGRVWKAGAACKISDVVLDAKFPRARRAGDDDLHGAFGVPIRVGGRLFGVLEFFTHNVCDLSDELLLTMDAIGSQIGLFIQRVQSQEQERDLQEQLQCLATRLVMVQEAERRHLARELHDELGQVLTGLKLMLETAARLPHAAAVARTEQALRVVRRLVEDVRALSLNLRPPMLEQGLVSALVEHFDQYSVGPSADGSQAEPLMKIIFEHAGVEAQMFSAQIRAAAFRIVQESVTNVIRHSSSREVTVRLQVDRQSLIVVVEDQGLGFDVEAAIAEGTTAGLAGMRERSSLLGGRLTINSAPGRGTRIEAELPLLNGIDDHSVKKAAKRGRSPGPTALQFEPNPSRS